MREKEGSNQLSFVVGMNLTALRMKNDACLSLSLSPSVFPILRPLSFCERERVNSLFISSLSLSLSNVRIGIEYSLNAFRLYFKNQNSPSFSFLKIKIRILRITITILKREQEPRKRVNEVERKKERIDTDSICIASNCECKELF